MEISAIPEVQPQIWQTSVEELIVIFRDALLALIPIMDRSHIPYEDDKRYDDFDAIARVLHEQIVVSSIKWSFADEIEIDMPAYGAEFDSETHNAFIDVVPRLELAEKQYVFQNFSSDKSLFDTVVIYPFEKAESLFSNKTLNVPFMECRFQLRYAEDTRFNAKVGLAVLL